MIEFQRINNANNPLFATAYNLYCKAFPDNERRSWDSLDFEMMYQKAFSLNALLYDGIFVGIFHYWNFADFNYIEHFAITPQLRGKNLGKEALELFKKNNPLPILFEVELPTTPESKNRIDFYEHHGFTSLPHNYTQPPYEEGNDAVPMLLMSNEPEFANAQFEMIKQVLYEKVYHVLMHNT